MFDGEEGLRTDVRIAIELSLKDVLAEDEQREITDIEEEKLTHFAIRDLNLQLTYSWYLAGAHTVAKVNPTKRTPWKPGSGFRGYQTQDVAANETIQKLRGYFRSEEFISGYTLRDVWFTDKFEFLRDYYHELAPKKYHDLYIHSLDLREYLWNLNRILEKRSADASLSDFGSGGPDSLLDPSIEEKIRYSVSNFHMDLARVNELSSIKTDVVKSTDVVERIISKLTHLKTANAEQKMLMDKDIHDFFYYYVWKYPALAISADTAKGPNAQALTKKRLLEFNGFGESLHAETDNLSRQARGVDLLPTIDEPISDNSKKSTYLHSLLKDTVDTRVDD